MTLHCCNWSSPRVQLERCLDGKPEDSTILEMMLLVRAAYWAY